MKHPMTLPLFFSFFFSLLFSLFFVAVFQDKEEPRPPKAPPLAEICLRELAKPFTVEKDATKITCTSDKGQLIFYYDYQESSDRDWSSGGKGVVSFYRKEDPPRFCSEKNCLLIQEKDGVLSGSVIPKPASE